MSKQIQKVTGIGGVFLKVRDPKSLSKWYQKNLGIAAKSGYADFKWREHSRPKKKGRTIWSLFPADSDYFGPSRQTFMVNYRVANLDKMLAQLRTNGVKVVNIQDYDYGRFAWIIDPEGNRIELWEPKGE